MDRFRDHTAIITGAGTGIGRALAIELARAGVNVALAGRREDKLQESSKACSGRRSLVVPTDVSEHAQLERLVDRTLSHFGRLDILVNNAGIHFSGTLDKLTPEEVEHSVRVNLVAPIWLSRLSLPHLLRAPEGIIVNISSLSGLIAMPTQTVYAATKHGLSAFGQSLALDLRSSGIRVLTVYPGVVDTEMFSAETHAAGEEHGLRIPSLDPSTAARRIVQAMVRKRRALIVATAQDKLVLHLSRWAPPLFDLMLRRIQPAIDRLAEVDTRWARSRLKE